MKLIIFLILATSLYSCKTTEEIQREKTVDVMSMQMGQNQKLNAETTVRLQAIEQKLGMLHGKVEESDYSQQQFKNTEMDDIRKSISLLEEQIEELRKDSTRKDQELSQIRDRLKAQDKYLKELLDTLGSLGGKSKKPSKVKNNDPYLTAMGNYRKGRYKTALKELEELLGSKKYSGNKLARIYHNIGMIKFMNKSYNESIVLFSKLLSEYPKAPYNPNGMLFFAKSLSALKKTDEAQAVLQELIEKYPKSQSAKKAKKLVKK